MNYRKYLQKSYPKLQFNINNLSKIIAYLKLNLLCGCWGSSKSLRKVLVLLSNGDVLELDLLKHFRCISSVAINQNGNILPKTSE